MLHMPHMLPSVALLAQQLQLASCTRVILPPVNACHDLTYTLVTLHFIFNLQQVILYAVS